MAEERSLSQKEIDELLKTLGEQEVETTTVKETKAAVEYDFKKPHRLNNQQLLLLRNVFESLAKFIKSSFQPLLRAPVDCKMIAVEQLNYEEFLKSLPIPSCLYVLNLEGHHVTPIIEFSSGAIFPMIERILGSSAELSESIERPLTDIEWEVADRVLHNMIKTISTSIKLPYMNQYSIASRETNPKFVSVISTTEPIVSVTFEFTIAAKSKGLISIALPLKVAYDVLGKLTSSVGTGTSRQKKVPVESFDDAAFELSCFVGKFTLNLGDLFRIQEGTEIKFKDKLNNLLYVSIQNKPKFKGELGELDKGVRAVKIGKKLDDHIDGEDLDLTHKEESESSDIANGVEFDMSVEIATKKLDFEQVTSLSEGTIIKFEQKVDGDLKAYINGKLKGYGKAVRVGDKFGFKFTSFT